VKFLESQNRTSEIFCNVTNKKGEELYLDIDPSQLCQKSTNDNKNLPSYVPTTSISNIAATINMLTCQTQCQKGSPWSCVFPMGEKDNKKSPAALATTADT
jgi:hypothetical protein